MIRRRTWFAKGQVVVLEANGAGLSIGLLDWRNRLGFSEADELEVLMPFKMITIDSPRRIGIS